MAGFRFLDLPIEIRLMVYENLLPTEDEPEWLLYNPLIDTQKQTFLSLWRTCKRICAELPTISSLLSAGAIIPTVNVGEPNASTISWEESLRYLMPYLPSARYLHLRHPNEPEFPDNWIFDWGDSEIAKSALNSWLLADREKGDDQKKVLYLDEVIGYNSYIPHLYMRLDEQAVLNLDALELPDMNVLGDYRTATEGMSEEKIEDYEEERRRQYKGATDLVNGEVMYNFETLKGMYEDFSKLGFELVVEDCDKYGRFECNIEGPQGQRYSVQSD